MLRRKTIENTIHRMYENFCMITQKENVQYVGNSYFFSEITLDHIIPLNQNGEDEVENLQICCYQCNQMKGSILPVDLFQKVTEIFMYQIEKKTKHPLKWKIVHRLLLSCIK